MKKAILCLIILLSLMPSVSALGAGWIVDFNGVPITGDRDWKIVALGIVCSFVVHEAGHIVAAKLQGNSAKLGWDGNVVVLTNNPDEWFYRGGFVAQTAVSMALTALPYSRGSDFTVGFTGYSAFNSFVYGASGGIATKNGYSDVYNLDRAGGNGQLEAFSAAAINGTMFYFNVKQ